MSARVLRYHQCCSSTAAMRAYSSGSTPGPYRRVSALQVGDPERLDRDLGRRPGLDADPVLELPALSRCTLELGREPCRGDRVGVQAWSTTEVTVESFRVANL